MRRILRRGVLLLIGGISFPCTAMAQTVKGVLVDSQTGRPVAGAFLSLLSDDNTSHDTITSDGRGQFTLRGRGAGVYVISTEREAYASVLSDGIALEEGVSVSYALEVPPLSLRNMQQIGEALARNRRLQTGVGELCRGRMNPVEGGILLGVVREARTDKPVSGAVARFRVVEGGEVGELFTAITDQHGTYMFCFVPEGARIEVSVRAPSYRSSVQDVTVRRGTISWYDFVLSPRRDAR
jgi:Carboxypeptidase regulatory-like domain